jgi:hypothetical protein
MWLRYFKKDSEMVPFAPVVIGITFLFFYVLLALYFYCTVFMF